MSTIKADYLVVGSGAMGMAFTDVLMTETDATVVIVDRHHQPGGHWNDAYPYVRLHQPSAFYGVNSKHLGSDHVDTTGWNQGLYELATNSEVIAYFDQVMQRQFLASGRVQYFPSCEYDGNGKFKSLLSGTEYQVVAAKTVNATYMNVTVPSTRPPAYEIGKGVNCVPPNQLSNVQGQYAEYVVIGAGKTGMDACLFLLKSGVEPRAIRWIMPRDSWILDRATIQPTGLDKSLTISVLAAQAKALAEATDFKDAFRRAEANGSLIRLDPDIWPTMYRCATVTKLELEQLRRIGSIIRQGRVVKIASDQITLEDGAIATNDSTLHIDCSADGLATRKTLPVFDDTQITLQSVRTCQQVFSAAFIAHVEAAYENVEQKNALCTPVPHPDTDIDFLKTTLADGINGARWAEDPELSKWLANARLDGFSAVQPEDQEPDEATIEQVQKMQAVGQLAAENIQQILAAL